MATQGSARLSPRGWQSPYSSHSGLSTGPFSKLKDMVSGWNSGSMGVKEGQVGKHSCLNPLEQGVLFIGPALPARLPRTHTPAANTQPPPQHTQEPPVGQSGPSPGWQDLLCDPTPAQAPSVSESQC